MLNSIRILQVKLFLTYFPCPVPWFLWSFIINVCISAIFSAKIPAIILASDSKFSFIEQCQKFLAFLRVLLNPVCYICYFLESVFMWMLKRHMVIFVWIIQFIWNLWILTLLKIKLVWSSQMKKLFMQVLKWFFILADRMWNKNIFYFL